MSTATEEQPEAEKKKSKGKKGKKGKKEATAGRSVRDHPRAGAQVRRAKGWGGLAGFVIAGYLSLSAGVPPDQVGMRAIAAGVIGYMLAWACSVTVWRHLMVAELRAKVEQAMQTHDPKAAGPSASAPGGASGGAGQGSG